MDKCCYCLNRYGCKDEFEFNCKNNNYSHYEEEGIVTKCDECIHSAVCELEIPGDCEHFQSALEDTATINWVSRAKMLGGEKCPNCGYCKTPVHTIVDKVPYCSSCGKRLDDRFMNYCPNCGKKIRK